MKKFIAILLLFCSTAAQAYDDKISMDIYVKCLIKNQKINHYKTWDDTGKLMWKCWPQMEDMLQYNNCPIEDQMCPGAANMITWEVIQRVK